MNPETNSAARALTSYTHYCDEFPGLRSAHREEIESLTTSSQGALPRPVFVDAHEIGELVADIVSIVHTIYSLPARVFGGSHSDFLHAIGHTDEAVAAISAGSLGNIQPYGRADVLHCAEGYKVVELNTSSAVGGYWISQAGTSLMRRKDFAAFASQNAVSFTDAIETLVYRLRQLAGSVAGTDSPLIALVEEDGSGFKAHGVVSNLKDHGLTVEHVELGDVGCGDDGKITIHQDTPVDVVLRYFIARDVAKTPGGLAKLKVLADAHRLGKTAFFTALDSDLVEPKSTLALLYEPAVWKVLHDDERDAIQRRVPLTRMIQTGHFGHDFGVAPGFVSAKDDWVLKPFNGSGGRGVVLGSEVTAQEWDEQVLRTQDLPYVAQQRVWSTEEQMIDPGTRKSEHWRLHYGIFYSEEEGFLGGIAGGTPVGGSAIMAPGVSTFRRGCIFPCGPA